MPQPQPPADFPFNQDLINPPGVYPPGSPLHKAEARVFADALAHYRDGLSPADYDVPAGDEEMHVNTELEALKGAIEEAFGALTAGGPWGGLSLVDPEDAARQTAELGVFVDHLLVPLTCVNDAVVRACRNARRRTQGARARRVDEWTEFEQETAEGVRDAGREDLPFELRLAAVDRIIAHAQLQRARVVREREDQAWLNRRRPPAHGQ